MAAKVTFRQFNVLFLAVLMCAGKTSLSKIYFSEESENDAANQVLQVRMLLQTQSETMTYTN